MCQPAKCRSCSKTTWSGCGQHVDQVMRNVPQGQQCTCTGKTAKAAKSGGIMSRLLGR